MTALTFPTMYMQVSVKPGRGPEQLLEQVPLQLHLEAFETLESRGQVELRTFETSRMEDQKCAYRVQNLAAIPCFRGRSIVSRPVKSILA